MQILIVDDNEMIRRGVKQLLSNGPDYQICGEAANGQEAIAKAKQLQPALILLDISMPGSNGLEVAGIIRSELPSTKIIIMSQHDKAGLLPRALEAGADGCVDKNYLSSELLNTIDSLCGAS